MTASSRRLRESVTDLFLPRRCVVCGTAGSWLCSTCAEDLQALDERVCSRCGCPGAVAAACPECRDRDLAFGRAAAAFAYAGPARRLVGACKFRSLRSLAGAMADLAAPRFRVFVASLPAPLSAAAQLAESPRQSPAPLSVPGTAAVVTCVPPHRDHQLARGFNQAELLARELARAAGLPFVRLLARERETGSQHDLGRAARAANARGAFTLLPGVVQASEKLKRVVIIDDVYTTGETLNSCATVLVNAGFEPFAFTFARTVRASFHVSRSAAPAQLTASRRAGASTAS